VAATSSKAAAAMALPEGVSEKNAVHVAAMWVQGILKDRGGESATLWNDLKFSSRMRTG
jgi:hypothetical protein